MASEEEAPKTPYGPLTFGPAQVIRASGGTRAIT